MVLEKRDGKLPLSNKSLGVPCSEGPALNFPTSDGGGAWEGGEGAGEQRTLFSTAKDPLLALGTGIADLLLLPQPKPGKIFPKIIPNPPDEKPNCTRDLLEKIERERERERENGSERGRADCGGNCPRGGGIFQSPGRDSLREKVAAQLNFQTVCESTHL